MTRFRSSRWSSRTSSSSTFRGKIITEPTDSLIRRWMSTPHRNLSPRADSNALDSKKLSGVSRRNPDNSAVKTMFGFIGLVGVIAFLSPEATSAAYNPLTLRYDHHIFTIDADNHPQWKEPSEVWTYNGRPVK